jgi:hypothetical protein
MTHLAHRGENAARDLRTPPAHLAKMGMKAMKERRVTKVMRVMKATRARKETKGTKATKAMRAKKGMKEMKAMKETKVMKATRATRAMRATRVMRATMMRRRKRKWRRKRITRTRPRLTSRKIHQWSTNHSRDLLAQLSFPRTDQARALMHPDLPLLRTMLRSGAILPMHLCQLLRLGQQTGRQQRRSPQRRSQQRKHPQQQRHLGKAAIQ